ncbi:MAG: hypothetical protein IPL13_10855 [Saprospiraceae bacterium]|nr:hypothetical protein [Candidatus Brachybacter algidus]
MRAYTFTSVIILYFTINGYTQGPICNNYENFWKGESCFYNDQKDSAIIYYSKAYNNSRFGNVANSLNTISKAVECDSFNFAKKLLKVSLTKGLLDTSYYAKYFKEHPEVGLSTIFDVVPRDEYFSISKNYNENLNFVYIKVLTDLVSLDQKIRESRDEFDKYSKIVGALTFDAILKLIKFNGNKMLSYEQLGMEGSDALKTLLIHFELDQLLAISPFIIKAIKNGEFWANENYLYQLERSSIDENVLLKMNSQRDSIITYGHNNLMDQSLKIYYSNYGTLDYYIDQKVGGVWWPLNPDVDREEVDILRNNLGLQTLNELFISKPFVKVISIEDFIRYSKR